MNLNRIFTPCKITIFFITVFLILCSYHWISISKLNKIIYNNKQIITNTKGQFIYYIDKNTDIFENELDTCHFHLKNILVYRFAEDMCNECIQQDLKELNSFQEKIGKQHLFIIPCYDIKRENNILLSNLLEKFNYKNLPDSIIKFPIHRKTGEFARYIAYIDKHGRLSSIFYPLKNKQILTQLYLNSIKKKFNNSTPKSY